MLCFSVFLHSNCDKNLSFICAAFWHADVFPPQPHPLAEDAGLQKIPSNAVPLYLKPIEVMLQVIVTSYDCVHGRQLLGVHIHSFSFFGILLCISCYVTSYYRKTENMCIMFIPLKATIVFLAEVSSFVQGIQEKLGFL